MAARASAIVVAELTVVASRHALSQGLRRLQRGLSRPSSLAAAAAVGALLGFSLHRGRTGAVAGMLAGALIRHGVKGLIAHCATYLLRNASGRSTPNARAAALRTKPPS